MISRTFKHIFFWLSGAGSKTLEQCPNWEQRKYVAFGATLLVPALFAILSCGYAISTLTDNWRVVVAVSAVWGFIILTIDRALLATYRSFQPFHRKLGQFGLRIAVAALMGITISHPLTLLLFKDTIQAEIEKGREAEVIEVRRHGEGAKAGVEQKITAIEAEIAAKREQFTKSYQAEFLVEDSTLAQTDPNPELDPQLRAELEQKIKDATAEVSGKIATAEQKIEELGVSYQKIQGELDFWQREFEREINGQRSGLTGEGPRARSIRDDQLAWRREEAKRIGDSLAFATSQRNSFSGEKTAIEERVRTDFVGIAAEKANVMKAERERVAGLKRQVQEQQADLFVGQQNSLRQTIPAQIDARLGELKRLQGELARLADDEQDRVTAIKEEPRRDILTQTLALHGLFRRGEDGGQFALIAYGVLALLFMLVDTIPLIVKFFSKPGPYDALVDCDEVRFERERSSFLHSYHRYMDELTAGRMLHLSPANKPLERALIEGVDRSRAAKEFIEHLMDLERAFRDKIAAERAALAEQAGAGQDAQGIHSRAQLLEEMSRTFYADLRSRMTSFFEDPKALREG
ncbi:MAG TPA: DUF4407 domain-containing protein [Luteolibacter sp.]|nr:DUF4407 domain-containing protein [Luteolibacter sp.]